MTPKSFAETLIEAARQVAAETPGDRAATARRIHESLARRRRVQKRRINVVAAIMATLFGSTAFAWYAGWQPPWGPRRAPVVASQPPAPVERVRSAPPPVAPTAPTAIDAPPVASLPDPAVAAVPEAIAVPASPSLPETAPAETAPDPTPPAPARVTRRNPPLRATPPASPAVEASPVPDAEVPRRTPAMPELPAGPAPAAAPAVSSEELAYYRRAHDAHFRGRDPFATLAAWDEYLARFPEGQLALEARYDRALILIKLARWSAAEAALRPFATARPGSYRQAEAARLLDAVRSSRAAH